MGVPFGVLWNYQRAWFIGIRTQPWLCARRRVALRSLAWGACRQMASFALTQIVHGTPGTVKVRPYIVVERYFF